MSKYSIILEAVWTLVNIALLILNHYLGKAQDEYIKKLEYQNKSLIRYAKWLTEGIRSSKTDRWVCADNIGSMETRTDQELIDPIPSIDMVRCEECKYWGGCKSTAHNSHQCGRMAEEQNPDYYTRADDFCSYGERKDNE